METMGLLKDSSDYTFVGIQCYDYFNSVIMRIIIFKSFPLILFRNRMLNTLRSRLLRVDIIIIDLVLAISTIFIPPRLGIKLEEWS